jgi:4'-phosphopantetheinyl transferase
MVLKDATLSRDDFARDMGGPPIFGDQCSWPPSPESADLPIDEVHVWVASLELAKEQVERMQLTLTEDERKRAERFHFEKDRRHYIVARARLRAILARYLQIEPGRIRFSYTPYGKPLLTDESQRHGVRFNVSHSRGMAFYAIARGREIGIDLEHVRKHANHDRVAEHFFSDRETATLRSLPTEVREIAFYNCWTRKEAYIKAKGIGLSLALKSFDVSLAPGEPAALLRAEGDPQEASRWSLKELESSPGYVAALAVEGDQWRLKCWRWAD